MTNERQMTRLTLESARALRDGGIDAMAALNAALIVALGHAPEDAHRELKHATGFAMAAVADETINPAVAAFPELDPSQEEWAAIARAKVTARAAAYLTNA